MSKYKVMVRRNADEEWSVWSDTDRVERIIEMVDRIRELGWEAKVLDYTVSVSAVVDHINAYITNIERERDSHKNDDAASLYMICNTQISTLIDVKKFVRKLGRNNDEGLGDW